MKKAYVRLLIVLMLCTVMPWFAVAQGETAAQTPLTPVEQLVDAQGHVVFTDALVEEAIRTMLGQPDEPITKKQLGRLGERGEQLVLAAEDLTVADLSVLQLCSKLQSLFLDRVMPADLRVVSTLPRLAFFMARDIPIENLHFLTGMKSLTDVWIGGCPCEDISAVTAMPSLINFSIDIYIDDISPLYACKKLVALALCELTDAQVNTLLDKLGHQLTGFGLNSSTITDETLVRISGMKLLGIMLDNTPVTSLAPLWNIKTLQSIELLKMPIDSLEGIENLKKLKWVTLLDLTGVTDCSSLYQLAGIVTLSLSGMDAPALEGIQNMAGLKELTLEMLYGDMDITPVFALKKLETLTLNDVALTTLAGIEAMASLTELSLYQIEGIEDYSPLTGLTKLKVLHTDIPEYMPEGLPLS